MSTSESYLYTYIIYDIDPRIVVRSVLKLFFRTEDNFLDMGPMSRLIRQGYNSFCATTTPFCKGEMWDYHLSRIAKPMFVLFTLFVENRTRQRTRYA